MKMYVNNTQQNENAVADGEEVNEEADEAEEAEEDDENEEEA